ncbi:MFS transporter [Actinacidiphila glaucinigra]|uniref:MFS transporter n=1 Tax=Actinacidiphila glaucinigra TaxID=235986 RepID=UPI00366BC607
MYAVLFADAGLSEAGISSLFAVWSLTAFLLEVPSGVWADRFSRRALLTVAPLLAGAGFTLWTLWPCYASFAAGFVLWGAGSALRSGALQALVHEELTRVGARHAYARLTGRAQALGTTAALVATALAGPLLAAGGDRAVGLTSVAVTVLTATAALALPEPRGRGAVAAEGEAAASYAGLLREALGQARHTPGAGRMVAVVSLLAGATALDEYVPLLAQATGVRPSYVPLLVLLVTAGATAGGWLAGRGTRWAPLAPAVAAVCLAAGAAGAHPAGLTLVALAFGLLDWATTAADAALQERITDRTRATVTSLAGLGSEAGSLLLFGLWALGSHWSGPGPLFALAALPLLLPVLLLWRCNIFRPSRRQ